jgi:hypothetical protein
MSEGASPVVRVKGALKVPSGCWKATWTRLSMESATTRSFRPTPVRSPAAMRVGTKGVEKAVVRVAVPSAATV